MALPGSRTPVVPGRLASIARGASRQAGLVLAVLAGLLAAGPAWAQPTSEVSGCAGSTLIPFDLSGVSPLPLNLMVPVTLLTGLVHHPCPGPVYLRGNAFVTLAPTAVDAAALFARPRLTCLGSGCPVTGLPVEAAPGSTTVAFRDKGLPDNLAVVLLVGVFPDLPPGTYQLEVLAFGVNGEGFGAEVYLLDGGGPTGAGRTAP